MSRTMMGRSMERYVGGIKKDIDITPSMATLQWYVES
jgi:hypothetical protein